MFNKHRVNCFFTRINKTLLDHHLSKTSAFPRTQSCLLWRHHLHCVSVSCMCVRQLVSMEMKRRTSGPFFSTICQSNQFKRIATQLVCKTRYHHSGFYASYERTSDFILLIIKQLSAWNLVWNRDLLLYCTWHHTTTTKVNNDNWERH